MNDRLTRLPFVLHGAVEPTADLRRLERRLHLGASAPDTWGTNRQS